MSTIACGHCHEHHASVAAVRACSQEATIAPCHWLVEVSTEDGRAVVECGAEAIFTERGYTCAAGHQHVNAQARHAEGWDYAESWGEAMDLARAGVEPLTMDGHLVTAPADFAHA